MTIEPNTRCTHCGNTYAQHAGDLELPIPPVPLLPACRGAKSLFGTGPCWACGKTYAEHADAPDPRCTPRMPCLGLKAHFHEREAALNAPCAHKPQAVSVLLASVDLGMRLHQLDRNDELYNCAAHLVRAAVAYVDATDGRCTGSDCPLCVLLQALLPFIGEQL